VFGYITGNLHVYDQVRSAQSACNSVIEILFLFFKDFLFCVYTSVDSYFCLSVVSVFLSLNVGNGVRLYYDSLYVHIVSALFLCVSFVLNICISVGLYCH